MLSSSLAPATMAGSPGGATQIAKTFAAATIGHGKFKTPSIPVHAPASTDGGDPACFFSKEEIALSVEAMNHAIIAKTSYGRPAVPEIKAFLKDRLKLEEEFSIAALDNRHLLLRFCSFEDYLKVLLKEILYVKARLFRFFKWTINFDPNENPVVLPTWIELSGLPANFFADSFIRSIARNLEVVLQVAFATQAMLFAGAAKVCIELDITKPRYHRIWVGTGDGSGFWQRVCYPSIPSYCNACKKVGHLVEKCKSAAKDPVNVVIEDRAHVSDRSGIQMKDHREASGQGASIAKGKEVIVALPSSSNSSDAIGNTMTNSGQRGEKTNIYSG